MCKLWPEITDIGWSSDYGYVISHLVGVLAYNLHIIYMHSAAQSPYVDVLMYVDAQLCIEVDVRQSNKC